MPPASRAVALAALVWLSLSAAPVEAVTSRGQPVPPPAQQVAASIAAYQRAQQDLQAAQSSIARLDSELMPAQQAVTAAEQRAAADAQREDELRREIGVAARGAYQTEGSELSAVLEARTIAQLWDAMAEARLVSLRRRSLLDELHRVRAGDESALQGARAARERLMSQRDQARALVANLEQRLSGLAATVQAAGTVLTGSAGPVPAGRLPQTTGDAGQCTWYAEQAWTTYSDPGSPALSGDGADVVPNLAGALGRPVDLQPQPGSLVSWGRGLLSGYGHVAYVASVDRDAAGNLTGYTVWEMNYQGPFVTDARHVPWTGPNPRIVFMSPPQPVDPIAAALSRFGPWS